VTTESILVEESDTRVLVRLNRSDTRNAIDRAMVDALGEVCRDLEARPRVLLIRGEGEHFAAGADIEELRRRGRAEALEGINSSLFERVRRLPMPTIALLDGYALGGGAELAYACDLRIGTPHTRLGNPEPGLGIVAAAGACVRLVGLVGEARAKQVLLGGAVLDADTALAWGLLSEIVPREDLELAGHGLADAVCGQAALAVRLTKALIHAPAYAHPLVDDLAQAVLFETEEKNLRMDTFLARRRDRT
jgi:enoyl-CoA hydratase